MKSEDVVEIKRTITSYSGLKKDWNTYKAKPIDLMAIDMAKCFIYELFCKCQEVHKPYIGPTCYGGVQFEWDFISNDKVESAVEFEVRIEDGRTVYDWLICPDDSKDSTWTEIEGYDGNPMECEAIQKVIEWSREFEELR